MAETKLWTGLIGEPAGLMDLTITIVRDINRRCQDVKVHRRHCEQLAGRCAEVVGALRDGLQLLGDSELRETMDELEGMLLKVRKRITEWANLNQLRSLARQGQIFADINTLDKTLDTYVTKSQLVLPIELNGQRRANSRHRQDQEDIKEMLQALVHSAEDLQTVAGMQDDVPALMQFIMEELAGQQSGTDEHTALQEGLNTLQVRAGIFPSISGRKFTISPIHSNVLTSELVNGQIFNLKNHSEAGTMDVYEGQWLGNQKVMLRIIQHIGSESITKRLHQEVDVWRRLQHIHVSQFYGTYYVGQRLFSVTPWADGGNLLAYIQSDPDCDRMNFLREVALGLMYLHTFNPIVVHGNLRAANVLLSASGEALLTDFGLSKVLAEEEGAGVTSTSLCNSGSSRWMAPELFEVDIDSSVVSAAADVWSFGMLCLEILTGKPPYQECLFDGQVIAKLLAHVPPKRPGQSEEMNQRGLSDNVWNVMQRCWAWRGASRPLAPVLASDMRLLHHVHMRQREAVTGKRLDYHPGLLTDV